MKLSRSKNRHKDRTKERTYPFYAALDFSLQFLLSAAVLIFAVALLGIILINSSPQFFSHATNLARQIVKS